MCFNKFTGEHNANKILLKMFVLWEYISLIILELQITEDFLVDKTILHVIVDWFPSNQKPGANQ